jgi:hypothetical protein
MQASSVRRARLPSWLLPLRGTHMHGLATKRHVARRALTGCARCVSCANRCPA